MSEHIGLTLDHAVYRELRNLGISDAHLVSASRWMQHRDAPITGAHLDDAQSEGSESEESEPVAPEEDEPEEAAEVEEEKAEEEPAPPATPATPATPAGATPAYDTMSRVELMKLGTKRGLHKTHNRYYGADLEKRGCYYKQLRLPNYIELLEADDAARAAAPVAGEAVAGEA